MEAIAHIVETDGLAVTISVIVLYASVRGINIYFNHLEHKYKSSKHLKGIAQRIDVSPDINNILSKMMYQLQASRAGIFEYHNGGENFANLPFAKMSLTYETTNDSVIGYRDMLQNLPLSNFQNLSRELAQSPYILLDTVKRDSERGAHPIGGVIYEVMASQNVRYTVMVPLVDRRKNIIFGSIALDYNLDNDNFKPEYIEELQRVALEVQSLLTLKV